MRQFPRSSTAAVDHPLPYPAEATVDRRRDDLVVVLSSFVVTREVSTMRVPCDLSTPCDIADISVAVRLISFLAARCER